MRGSPQYPSPLIVQLFFFLMRNFKTYSLNNFQICSAILSVIATMLYIIFPWLIHFINACLYFLTTFTHFAYPHLWQLPVRFLFCCSLGGYFLFYSVQCSSVAQLCPTLYDPRDCSTPGFPVHHQLPELTQTHVHPTILFSVIPFSSCLQPFPASGSFPMSQFFTSGGQSIGVSVSASVLPMTIQGWFPLGLTGLILQSKGLSRVFSNTTVQKHQFFGTQLSL